MRNYFELKLKGSRLAAYMIVWWLIYLGFMTLYIVRSMKTQAQEPDLFNLDYAINFQIAIFRMIGEYLLSFVLLYFIVKYTLAALTYDGQNPETNFDFKKYLWLLVKGMFLSAISLCIYFPWLITKVIMYFASNTSFGYNTFSFNGRPLTLFSLTVVFSAAPALLLLTLYSEVMTKMLSGADIQKIMMMLFVGCFIFIFLQSCYLALLAKWIIDFSLGRNSIALDVKGWYAGWFIMGQILLIIITLGFYAPAAMLRIYRYFARRTVVGGETVESRAGFSLNVWRDYFYLLGQGLLMIVTVGIYIPWAYARVMNRIVSKTYLESAERKDLSMPSAG